MAIDVRWLDLKFARVAIAAMVIGAALGAWLGGK